MGHKCPRVKGVCKRLTLVMDHEWMRNKEGHKARNRINDSVQLGQGLNEFQ